METYNKVTPSVSVLKMRKRKQILTSKLSHPVQLSKVVIALTSELYQKLFLCNQSRIPFTAFWVELVNCLEHEHEVKTYFLLHSGSITRAL